MPNPLSPEQQAALDKFEEDAQAAGQAGVDNANAQIALMQATQTAATDAQAAIDTHTKALQSAQAFIDLMVPPTPATTAAGSSAAP